jgi:hypothetical protein
MGYTTPRRPQARRANALAGWGLLAGYGATPLTKWCGVCVPCTRDEVRARRTTKRVRTTVGVTSSYVLLGAGPTSGPTGRLAKLRVHTSMARMISDLCYAVGRRSVGVLSPTLLALASKFSIRTSQSNLAQTI